MLFVADLAVISFSIFGRIVPRKYFYACWRCCGAYWYQFFSFLSRCVHSDHCNSRKLLVFMLQFVCQYTQNVYNKLFLHFVHLHPVSFA